jgi:vacuolar-type H+-ATPase subunit B/Vma2
LTRAPGELDQDEDESMIAEMSFREEIVREGDKNKSLKKQKGKVEIGRGRIRKNHDEVADSVMMIIAEENKVKSQSNSTGELNHTNSRDDLALLRDRIMLPMTLVFIPLFIQLSYTYIY